METKPNQTNNGKWKPDIDTLPPIVRTEVGQWLTPQQRKRRQRAICEALLRMVHDGECKPFTTILPLQGKRGDVIEKEFTFYKTVHRFIHQHEEKQRPNHQPQNTERE